MSDSVALPSAREMLEMFTGYAANAGGQTPSADRPVRLATIDGAYTGAGSPKVTFDGEGTMGTRTYVWVGASRPRAGERVVMLPVGQSFVILGAISNAPGAGYVVGQSIEGYWTSAPAGFLAEDGGVLSRTSYPDLFAVIGTTFNTGGETASQFRLPHSLGRVQVAKDSATFSTLGARGGAETVVLSPGQMPSHSHTVRSTGDEGASGYQLYTSGNGFAGRVLITGQPSGSGNTTSIAGADQAHENKQPYIVVLRCIKY